MTLTFDELRQTNAARCGRWHGEGTEPWLGVDWSNAMGGEAGEAQNVVKKIRRIDTGTATQAASKEVLVDLLADEIADTVIYADLLAAYYGIDLAAAIGRKFNEVSMREGFPERLPVIIEGRVVPMFDDQPVILGVDQLAEWTDAYGARVTCIGEDETSWVALGHIDPLRMIAASRKVGRKLGLNDEETFGYTGPGDGPLTSCVKHHRAVFVDHQEYGWYANWSEEAASSPHAIDLTVWSS